MAHNSYYPRIMLLKVLFTISLVLRLHNKMVELNANTNTCLMLAELCYTSPNYLNVIGLMLFYMPHSLSIVLPPLYFTTNPHISVYMILYPPLTHLRSLVPFVMPLHYKFTKLSLILELENPCF
jgi:hypothetical protein